MLANTCLLPDPCGSSLHKSAACYVEAKADLQDSSGACNIPPLDSQDGGLAWQPEACNVEASSDQPPRVVAQIQYERVTSTLLQASKELKDPELDSSGLYMDNAATMLHW